MTTPENVKKLKEQIHYFVQYNVSTIKLDEVRDDIFMELFKTLVDIKYENRRVTYDYWYFMDDNYENGYSRVHFSFFWKNDLFRIFCKVPTSIIKNDKLFSYAIKKKFYVSLLLVLILESVEVVVIIERGFDVLERYNVWAKDDDYYKKIIALLKYTILETQSS